MPGRRSRWNQHRKQQATERAQKHRQRQRALPVGTQVQFLFWCEKHGKKAMVRADARKLRRALAEPGLRVYPCDEHPSTHAFHVGHLPDNVRSGYVSADQIYRKET